MTHRLPLRLAILLPMLLLAACATSSAPSSLSPGFAGHFSSYVVCADHPSASQAGAVILDQGGNAVDAAVATSFALSVCRPYSCGIGGGGFMIIHLVDDPRTETPGDAVSVAIDYRERAPAAITPLHFVDLPEDASTRSGQAVAIPGTVAGLLLALEEFGTMDRRQVLRPAIELARGGFEVDAHYVEHAQEHIDLARAERAAGEADLRIHPFIWDRFLRQGDLQVGDVIRLPEQAKALERIASHGASGFQSGRVAEAIVRAVESDRLGGVLTLEDLRHYRPRVVEPLRRDVMGRTVIAMPPPSSGGVTLLQILVTFDATISIRSGRLSPAQRTHLLIESMKHAFADRAAFLADPEFSPVDVDAMLDIEMLRGRGESIDLHRTQPSSHYGMIAQLPEDGGTSHFSVIDGDGNAVACTETINLVFGSRVPVPEFGFVLNNQMDDFLTRPGVANAYGLTQSERNLPAPGKRPLSSMSPTIVLDAEGRVEVIAGASGGPRIITGTVQVILEAIDGASARQAMTMPRIHHQWSPDAVYTEEFVSPGGARFDPAFLDGLAGAGHEIRERRDVGNVQLIRRSAGGGWDAAADPRKGGRPAGR
ncbi:MAG: gamma-glutamyltransferase [Planctomycetota bacterium]